MAQCQTLRRVAGYRDTLQDSQSSMVLLSCAAMPDNSARQMHQAGCNVLLLRHLSPKWVEPVVVVVVVVVLSQPEGYNAPNGRGTGTYDRLRESG